MYWDELSWSGMTVKCCCQLALAWTKALLYFPGWSGQPTATAKLRVLRDAYLPLAKYETCLLMLALGR